MAMVSVIPGEVRRLRLERGMKQLDLAERAKIDLKTLRAMELATAPVREETLRNVARELGVPWGRLVESRVNSIAPIRGEAALTLRVLPADDLFDEIRQAGSVRWHLSINPNQDQIAKLRILEGRIESIRELDATHADGKLSSQLDILAAREELKTWIDALQHEGFSLLAGSYLFWECDEERVYDNIAVHYTSIRVLQLALTPAKQTVLALSPDPGKEPPLLAPNDGLTYLQNGIEIPREPARHGRFGLDEEDDDLPEEIPF